MAEPANDEQDLCGGDSWFADILGDGTSLGEQLQAVRVFAYEAFDRLDRDKNGFLSHAELEEAINSQGTASRERLFLSFLLDNHEQIADAFDERTIADGISRGDLEAYFDLVSTLL